MATLVPHKQIRIGCLIIEDVPLHHSGTNVNVVHSMALGSIKMHHVNVCYINQPLYLLTFKLQLRTFFLYDIHSSIHNIISKLLLFWGFDIFKVNVVLDKSTQQWTECPLLDFCPLRFHSLLHPKSIKSGFVKSVWLTNSHSPVFKYFQAMNNLSPLLVCLIKCQVYSYTYNKKYDALPSCLKWWRRSSYVWFLSSSLWTPGRGSITNVSGCFFR